MIMLGKKQFNVSAAARLCTALMMTAATCCLGCGNDAVRDALVEGRERPIGRIGASPNPVPAEAGAKTLICWDMLDEYWGEVWISFDGSKDLKLFAAGARSASEVDWIQPGHQYDFQLYVGRDRAKLVDRVIVTRLLGPPASVPASQAAPEKTKPADDPAMSDDAKAAAEPKPDEETKPDETPDEKPPAEYR